jgi:8-oxo-dGTP pyrophosphatase MutT (NUDIX family)
VPGVVEKVTAFITRESEHGCDLLLFEHPYAGIQIPAGTVEEGETPEEAVIREAHEETGLAPLSVQRYLGCRDETVGPEERIIAKPSTVYARPDETSFDWAHLPRGAVVTVKRSAAGFSQVTYVEVDRWPNPQYATMEITGWVPEEVLSESKRRHFFHLQFEGESEERWITYSDSHFFTLFWASVRALPEIIPPQAGWLQVLYESGAPELLKKVGN